MVGAEVRYVGDLVKIVAAILLPMAIAIAAHLPAWATLILYFVVLGVEIYGIVFVWLWRLRTGRASIEESKKPSARYSPGILNVAVLLSCAYTIVTSIPILQATRLQHGVEPFVVASLLAVFTLVTSIKDRRKAAAGGSSLPKVTQKRLAQFSAAFAPPTIAEQRRALRPLVLRGYARLGLLVLEIVLVVALVPHFGIALSVVMSFAFVGATFLIVHKVIDL